MTGLTTLRRAIEIRDNLMGGWDKVIVLGWNFSPTIGHDIEALGQADKLEVLVIPPDLLDRLKKKGHKLKADEVRFSSLQYLKLGEVLRRAEGKGEALDVAIRTVEHTSELQSLMRISYAIFCLKKKKRRNFRIN